MAIREVDAVAEPEICLWNSPVPAGWQIVRISDVFTRVTRRIAADDLPVLTISAKAGFLTQEERYSRFMAGESLKRYIELHRGEFAYNRGNSKTYPYGCVYPLTEHQKAAVPHVYYCFQSREEIDLGFFVQYFASGALNAQLARINNAGVRGNGLLNVGADEFFRMEIPRPPLAEQRKIAAVLNSVDDAIQAAEAVIEQSRSLDRELLAELITRGIGHTRFKQTEIGEVPEGWDVVSIGSLCEFSSGNGFGAGDWSEFGLPIIRIQNLNGSRQFNYYAGPTKDNWIIEPGDLLFAWAGVKGVSFGPCLWSGPRGVLNQHIYRISPRLTIDKTWLFETFELITRRIEARAHGFKASLLHVRKSEIIGELVALPSAEEQQQIAARAVALRLVREREECHLESLRKLKVGLLHDLLTGRVRVSID
jgi:hypothetical protein